MGICESNNKKSTGINKEDLKDEIQEKIINFEATRIIRYMKKADATCLILKPNKNYGTGFFCEIIINKKKIKGLFTCNHILNENDIKIGSKINIIIKDIINNIDIKKNIEITNERFTCTNKNLDYTFIKIFNDESYNNFFQIDNEINCNNPYEKYKLEEFGIIQYPNGKLSISEGKLKKIENEILFYSIPTNKGSSGSPVIVYTKDLNIIGIHYYGGIELNRGIYFKNILDDIITQIKDICLDDI